MKSTPERAEALRYAASLGGPFVLNPDQQKLFNEMLSECEQELPQPLVFKSEVSGVSTISQYVYLAQFSRPLTQDDSKAIRAALTKAFPAENAECKLTGAGHGMNGGRCPACGSN